VDLRLQEGRPADEKTCWSSLVRSVYESAFWHQSWYVEWHIVDVLIMGTTLAKNTFSVVYYLPSALGEFVELPRSTTLLIAGFIQL
jgi:hypothetical protein